MNCPLEMSIGAYALGTLDAGERAQVTEHLPTCACCQAALDSFAGLPGLLARVRPTDLMDEQAKTEERIFDRLVASALRDRRHRRRRLLAAAAAATVLFSGTGIAIAVARDDASSPHAGRMIAATQGPVHAWVWLHPTASSTRLTVDLSGVAPEQRCRLVAVDDAGRREVAAMWEATYEGQASITGSTDIPVDRLTWLVIETTDNRRLVRVPVSG